MLKFWCEQGLARGSNCSSNCEHKELLLETVTYHMNPLIISSEVGAESTSQDMGNLCARTFVVMNTNMLNKLDKHIKKVFEFVNKFKNNLEGYNDCLD